MKLLSEIFTIKKHTLNVNGETKLAQILKDAGSRSNSLMTIPKDQCWQLVEFHCFRF